MNASGRYGWVARNNVSCRQNHALVKTVFSPSPLILINQQPQKKQLKSGSKMYGRFCRLSPIAFQNGNAQPPPHRDNIQKYNETPKLVPPDAFTVPQGALTEINRTSSPHLRDIFYCPGCTDSRCQSELGCAETRWRLQPGGYLREILTSKVYDVATETPLQCAKTLSATLGSQILLKREDLQPVKSFKIRGAYNKMAQLTPEQLKRGVICSSAGNHAQGVALAASYLGCSAFICMPAATPAIKVAAVRALGGIVELVGETYQEAQARAHARAAAEGLVFIAPYDDPFTIAGQGTIAAEILRQCNMDNLDAIFVPVGGGGLVAGIAAYTKALKPNIRVIGVEPVGANAMAQSLALGERVKLSQVDVFADGVAVKHVGAETFRVCRNLIDGIVLVDNAAISTAIKDVFNETRSILEPSGAVAVAGAKAYLKHYNLKGQNVVAVTSGANMNFDRLRQVADLTDFGETQAMLAASLPEVKGSFLDFVNTVLSESNAKPVFTELKYRYCVGRDATVLFSVNVGPGSKECLDLIKRLEAKNFRVTDISGVQLAQLHLRHLVGGRGGSGDALPNEIIFYTEYPERPGSLRESLPAVSPRWNITLFHYRITGNRSSGVLIGLDVPPEEKQEFLDRLAPLEKVEYLPREVVGRDKEIVKMFLQ